MSYGQPCSRITGGPSAGPPSAYPTLSAPASTCLSDAKDARDPGGAASTGVDAQLATEVTATARPAARAKLRREIMRHSCHRAIVRACTAAYLSPMMESGANTSARSADSSAMKATSVAAIVARQDVSV